MRVINLIILILLAILATSCGGKEIGRCDLTEAQKQLIRYKKGQIICFTDGNGQAVNFSVTESELSWLRQDIDEESSFGSDYYTYRRKLVKLESSSNNLEIFLWIDSEGCLSEKLLSSFVIAIGYGQPTIWEFSSWSDAAGNFLIINSATFHESIEINGKVYYDVLEQKNHRDDSRLFYNKTYGILQINRDGENFLTINHKTDENGKYNNPVIIDCLDFPLADSAGAD